MGIALMTCDPVSPYTQHHYQDVFVGQYHYDVNPDRTTDGGILVDTSGQDIDISDLDRQTDEVERCLVDQFGDPPVIPLEDVKASDCDSQTFPIPIRRQDLVVKVAMNWTPSCDGSQQVLPVPAPQALCDAKGMYWMTECPGCFWRAGIQQNRFIIVTPNYFLYKDPLIRLVTGCNNPWTGRLATCAHL